jgi:hypothetical protein
MTRDDFLARCANAYDAGLMTPERIRLMDSWLDFVLRFEGGQMNYVADFIEDERRRCRGFHAGHTLAGDINGYALIQFAAILTHSCQICATDPKAWWTRPAFCPHRNRNVQSSDPEER